MRLTKTQLEERFVELGDELLEAEMMDDREKYYELLEQQIRLSANLHYGEHTSEPQPPACNVCKRRSRRFRFVHWEVGDGADFCILCPNCVSPRTRTRTRARTLNAWLAETAHWMDCECGIRHEPPACNLDDMDGL
jgi:hypothetical protein